MFKAVASINGKLMSPDKAKISAFDNSLLYAEGLFETFLGVGDRVAFAKEHLDRLHRGAKVIGLKIPASRTQIERWMRSALKAHPAYIKQLRLTVTAGDSARWRGKAGKPQVVILVGPHQLPTTSEQIDGLSVSSRSGVCLSQDQNDLVRHSSGRAEDRPPKGV